MFSQTVMDRIREKEAALGETMRCVNCGRGFNSGDNCPHCGSYASPIDLVGSVRTEPGMSGEVWYVLHMDKETGEILKIKIGDSCPWPRPKGATHDHSC
jgi:hypothetical protein